MKYEYRFIAYIDILGFKDLIRKKDIKDILELLTTFQKHGLNNFNEKFTSGQIEKKYFEQDTSQISENVSHMKYREVSIFSDLIVISYSSSRNNLGINVFDLINDISSLQRALLFKKILVRGGITYDKLYHKDQICFGDGLIRAYELETKIAIYPRIVFDPRIMKFSVMKRIFEPLFTNLKYFEDGIYGVSHFKDLIVISEYPQKLFFSDKLLYESTYNEVKDITQVYLFLYKEIIVEGFNDCSHSIQSDEAFRLKLLTKFNWLAQEYKSALGVIKVNLKFNFQTIESLDLD